MNASSNISIGVDDRARRGASTNVVTLSMIALVVWIATASAFAQLPINSTTGPGTQTFKSPSGFSLTYPSNWRLAANKSMQSSQPEIGTLQTSVIVRDPYTIDNVSVVVRPESLPVNKSSADGMLKGLTEQAQRSGYTITNAQITQQTFAGHPALVADYGMTVNGYSLAMKQVALPDGDRTVIISCICQPSRSAIDRLTFGEMIDSVAGSLPAASSPFAGLSGIPTWLIGAVIGGIVGLVVWLIGLTSRARRDSQPTYGMPYQNPGQYQPDQYQNPGQYQSPGQGYQNPDPPQQNPGPPYQ